MTKRQRLSICKKLKCCLMIFVLSLVFFEMPIKVSASRDCDHSFDLHTYCYNSQFLYSHQYWDEDANTYHSCDVVGYYYKTTVRCVICGYTYYDYFVLEKHMQCGQRSVAGNITRDILIGH